MCNTKHFLIARAYDKRGRLLAEASNSYKKTHPLQSHFANLVGLPQKIYLHAEIACLIRSGSAKIHTLHVSRYNKRGDLRNAMPCPVCMAAIKAYGVRRVLYSKNNGDIVEIIYES